MRVLNAGYDLCKQLSPQFASGLNVLSVDLVKLIKTYGLGVFAHCKCPIVSQLHVSQLQVMPNAEIDPFLTIEVRYKIHFSAEDNIFDLFNCSL